MVKYTSYLRTFIQQSGSVAHGAKSTSLYTSLYNQSSKLRTGVFMSVLLHHLCQRQ